MHRVHAYLNDRFCRIVSTNLQVSLATNHTQLFSPTWGSAARSLPSLPVSDFCMTVQHPPFPPLAEQEGSCGPTSMLALPLPHRDLRNVEAEKSKLELTIYSVPD